MKSGHVGTAPEAFEPGSPGSGVVGGVPWVSVAEVVLDEAQVVALVGESEAPGMTQHVGMDRWQVGTLRGGGVR